MPLVMAINSPYLEEETRESPGVLVGCWLVVALGDIIYTTIVGMAPSPGTPVRGERGRHRPASPSGAAAGMEVDPPDGADAAMPAASASGPRRLYCPVASRPCSDPARAAGWAGEATLRGHVDAHGASGWPLAGDVPDAWLAARRGQRCAACGLSVASRFGVHPTCRPAAGRGVSRSSGDGTGVAGPGAAAQQGLPSLLDIQRGGTAVSAMSLSGLAPFGARP